MDAQLIEEFDKKRYRSMVLQTVGFAVWWGGSIAMTLLKTRPPEGILIASSLVIPTGSIVWIVGLVKMIRNNFRIKKNPDLQRALGNEMVQLYNYKSLEIGMMTAISTLVLIYALEWITHSSGEYITVFFTCGVTILVSYLATMISWLVYMRR